MPCKLLGHFDSYSVTVPSAQHRATLHFLSTGACNARANYRKTAEGGIDLYFGSSDIPSFPPGCRFFRPREDNNEITSRSITQCYLRRLSVANASGVFFLPLLPSPPRPVPPRRPFPQNFQYFGCECAAKPSTTRM